MTHDVQRVLTFQCELARGLRDPGFIGSRWVLEPALRQVKLHVDRRMPLAVRQDTEHRHLADIDLTQSPRPLPTHANRTISLLGEAALVDDRAARRLTTKQTTCVLADLRHHRLVAPRRVVDEVLELLRAAMLNHGGHRGERAVRRLRQTVQIASRHRSAVSRAGAKQPAVAGAQGRERLRYPIDQ
jgi:hypothetical protein